MSLTVVVGAFEPRRLVDPPQRTVAEPSPLPRLAGWHEEGDVELFRVTAPAGPACDWSRSPRTPVWPGRRPPRTGRWAPWPTPPCRRAQPHAAGRRGDRLHAGRTVAAQPWAAPTGPRSPRWTSSRSPARSRCGRPDWSRACATTAGLAGHPRADRSRRPACRRGGAAPSSTHPACRGPSPSTPGRSRSARARRRAGGGDRVRRAGGAGTNPGAGGFVLRAAGDIPVPGAGRGRRRPGRVVGAVRGGLRGPGPRGRAAQPRGARLQRRRARGGGRAGVRGRDAVAWPEVYFTGLGWYAFDPTPSAANRTERRRSCWPWTAWVSRWPGPGCRSCRRRCRPARRRPHRRSPRRPPVRHRGPGWPPPAAGAALALVVFDAPRRPPGPHGGDTGGTPTRARGRRSSTCWCCLAGGRRPGNRRPWSRPIWRRTRRGLGDGPHPAAVIAAAADRAAFAPTPGGDRGTGGRGGAATPPAGRSGRRFAAPAAALAGRPASAAAPGQPRSGPVRARRVGSAAPRRCSAERTGRGPRGPVPAPGSSSAGRPGPGR